VVRTGTTRDGSPDGGVARNSKTFSACRSFTPMKREAETLRAGSVDVAPTRVIGKSSPLSVRSSFEPSGYTTSTLVNDRAARAPFNSKVVGHSPRSSVLWRELRKLGYIEKHSPVTFFMPAGDGED